MSGKTRQRLIAACAAATGVLFLTRIASAGQVIFDLRVLDTGGKSAQVYAPGDVVWLGLYAIVQGDNSRTSDDGLWMASGKFLSSRGGLLGDLLAMPPAAPFNSMGSAAGTQRDLDGDGDLDVGGVNPRDSTGYFCVVSPTMEKSPPAEGFFLGQVRFTPRSSDAGATTAVNYAIQPNEYGILYSLDGGIMPKYDPKKNTIVFAGAPVTITASTPITPPGAGRYIDGTISDHVNVGVETVKPTAGSTLVINTGLSVAAGGSFDLRDAQGGYGAHQVHIDDATSGNSGGTIFAKDIYVGYAGTGVFTQDAGLTNLDRSMIIGGQQGSAGTLNLSGGKLYAKTLLSGSRGTGSFVQTGGSTMVEYFNLGASTGSIGTAELTANGMLTVLQNARIGNGGEAVFRQTGGVARFNNELRVGGSVVADAPRGSIELRDGALWAGRACIGDEAIGTMSQSGGTANFGMLLVRSKLDTDGLAPSTYNLSGGLLRATAIYIGSDNQGHGAGSFVQTGGTLEAVTGIGLEGEAYPAQFELRGGKLSSGYFQIKSNGTLLHTGGQSMVASLHVNGGILRYTGGSLDVSTELDAGDLGGEMDFANSAVTLSLGDNTVFDFCKGTISNSSRASLIIGSGSLTVLRPGFNPYTAFAHFETAGLIQYAGQPLRIPADACVVSAPSIVGNVTNEGLFGSGSSIGQSTIDGQFEQLATGALAIDFAGRSAEDRDSLQVNGLAKLDGKLVISLQDGFVPTSTDSFTILTANSIEGRFANALETVSFNGGMFDVIYTPTSVSLTNYQAIPEPGACALVLLGCVGLMARRRAKR